MRNYSDQSHHSLEQLSSYMSQLSVAFVQARRAPNQIDANAINTFFEQLLELDAALIQAMTSSSNIKSTTQSTKNKLKQNLNDDPEDIDPEALKAEYMKEHNLKVS
jgi:ABC-type transporter Mla subunit MlaD